MATLASDNPRVYETGHDHSLNELPVIAADIIYDGAAVGVTSGNARPLVAGDPFAGFAERNVDNSTGVAGAKRVKLRSSGVVKLSVTGVTAITDRGVTVYASDDDAFTLTSTSNSAIGKIIRRESGTTVLVAFQADAYRSL